MIKLVIFDFDDTLVLERDFITSGYKVCADLIFSHYKKASIPEIQEALWREFEYSTKNVFNRFLLKFTGGVDEIFLKKIIDTYRYHIPSIKYQLDVLPFVSELKKSGLHTAIVTDGDPKTQYNKLKAVNAFDTFDKVIITSQWGENWQKPSTLSFEYLKNYFNVEFSEMMYIGDNPKKDFAMKAKIPIYTARIIRSGCIYVDAKYLGDIREDILIKKFSELFNPHRQRLWNV